MGCQGCRDTPVLIEDTLTPSPALRSLAMAESRGR